MFHSKFNPISNNQAFIQRLTFAQFSNGQFDIQFQNPINDENKPKNVFNFFLI